MLPPLTANRSGNTRAWIEREIHLAEQRAANYRAILAGLEGS